MPNFLLSTISNTGRTLEAAQAGFITRDGGIFSGTADAVTVVSGLSALTNHGLIHVFGNGTRAINSNAMEFNLFNGQDGSITGSSTFGNLIDATRSLDIVNRGEISSIRGDAINLAASVDFTTLLLNNAGSINSNRANAVNADVADGFAQIRNFGEITAAATAVAITANTTAGIGSLLTNTGLISSSVGSAIVVSAGEESSFRILNTGVITAFNEAIQMSFDRGTDTNVINSGLLESRNLVDAVSLGDGEDNVLNTGTIIGDVTLGGSGDVFIGLGGTVAGVIFGGDGDDFFNVDQTDAFIDGGAGFDTVNTRGDFTSEGGVERIIMLGSDNISATGDAEANLILGNQGNNDIIAGLGNDTVRSGNGNDTISGGGGADILQGGAGEDVIAGGTGRDDLFGGLGADVFLFENVADSGIGGAFRDRIHDFEVGLDVIDLSELSDPSFTFQGTGALSGSGPSVSFSVVGAGFTLVRADVDGDGAQDMQILVLNTPVLTANDFLL